MKMTFQPKKRQRAKVHGFRSRMSTAGGRKVLACEKSKRKKTVISVGRIYVAFSSLKIRRIKENEVFRILEKK